MTTHPPDAAAFGRALALDPDSGRAHEGLAAVHLNSRYLYNARGMAQAAREFLAAVGVEHSRHSKQSRPNVDVVLNLFLYRIAYALVIAALLGVKLVVHTEPGLARTLPTILLAFPILFAARFLAGLTPELRRYLGRLVRRPVTACALAWQAVAAGGLVIGGASPQAALAGFIAAALSAPIALFLLRLQSRQPVVRAR